MVRPHTGMRSIKTHSDVKWQNPKKKKDTLGKNNQDTILTITLSRTEAQGDVDCILQLLVQTSHSTRLLEKVSSQSKHTFTTI